MNDRVSMRLKGRMLERFIGQALREGVRLQSVERTGVREMLICADERNALRLQEIADRYSLQCSVAGEAGRPRLKRRFRERSTLPLGLVLSLMLITSFTARIWRVEAVSLDGAADEEMLRAVCESAASLGIRPGRLRSDIDRDALAVRLHAERPEFTHVSVRTEGVFLRVEVAMEETAPEVYEIGASRDLAASRDAVIVYIEPLAGRACVKEGDVVRKGQTLIAGEERIGDDTTRGIRALGKVIGRVWFEAECRAQTTETVSARTGRSRTAASLRLLRYTWPLSEAENFAFQEAETAVLPIGGLYLPIRIERTILWETVQSVCMKEMEALREETGGKALDAAREKLPEGAAETDYRIEFSETDGILTARAVVEAEMDIAAERTAVID